MKTLTLEIWPKTCYGLQYMLALWHLIFGEIFNGKIFPITITITRVLWTFRNLAKNEKLWPTISPYIRLFGKALILSGRWKNMGLETKAVTANHISINSWQPVVYTMPGRHKLLIMDAQPMAVTAVRSWYTQAGKRPKTSENGRESQRRGRQPSGEKSPCF